MGTGKSIARAILGALGGGAEYYGDINKQKMLSSDDLYNALARLQMSEQLDRSNPMKLLQMKALQEEMDIARSREGRAADEYNRGIALEGQYANRMAQQARDAARDYNINAQSATDRVQQAIADEQAARDRAHNLGWWDAFKGSVRDGRSGFVDTITAPGRAAVGALFGDTPTGVFGVPQANRDVIAELKAATDREVALADEAYRRPEIVNEALAAGGADQLGSNAIMDARLQQRFPQIGVQTRASAQQELKQRELDLRASDIERKKSYGEGNLAIKIQALQQSAANEQVKMAVAQTKLMNDVQKAVLLKVLDGQLSIEEADAKVPGIKNVISELIGRLSE